MLRAAQRVVVFTGAGVSAESGVPTFRGPDGLWQRHRPEELATPEAFARDPRLVWEWYGWRREVVASCRPNPAHLAIAHWMLARDGVTLVSQNVDDLHERAAIEASGGASRASAALPVRLHGSLFHVRCTGCPYRAEHRDRIDASTQETLPRCPSCGALLRPDVVWFGEMLPPAEVARAFAAAGEADAGLVVGTSGAVYPAAAAAHAVLAAGGRLIVVDPGPTDYDSVATIKLEGRAGELVPPLLF
jgi:NAD-dependent deacetylase